MTQPDITLYQFELCPFCHKVKAGLEIKGLDYAKVGVNPMNKRELPDLPEDAPRKVPVVSFAGEIVYDSTDILRSLEARYPERSLTPEDDETRARSEEVEAWVDEPELGRETWVAMDVGARLAVIHAASLEELGGD